MYFSNEDLELIRFETKELLASDFKIETWYCQKVTLVSPSTNTRIIMQESLFSELMGVITIENMCLVGNFRSLRFKGKDYLLKEDSPEYRAALGNSSAKKITLKSGFRYLVRSNTTPRETLGTRGYSQTTADFFNTDRELIFIGNLERGYVNCQVNTILKKECQLRQYTSKELVFFDPINKKFMTYRQRKHFDLLEMIKVEPSFKDKEDTINRLNEETFIKVKEFFTKKHSNKEDKSYFYFYNSSTKLKNDISHGNMHLFEKIKLESKKLLFDIK